MDRDVARAGIAFQAVQYGKAVDIRQVQVEQDGRRQVVARQAQRRIALVTEGGYDLSALRECLDAVIRVLT